MDQKFKIWNRTAQTGSPVQNRKIIIYLFFGFAQNKKTKHGRNGPQRDKPVPVFVLPKAIIFSKFSFRNLVAKKYCSRHLVIMTSRKGYSPLASTLSANKWFFVESLCLIGDGAGGWGVGRMGGVWDGYVCSWFQLISSGVCYNHYDCTWVVTTSFCLWSLFILHDPDLPRKRHEPVYAVIFWQK